MKLDLTKILIFLIILYALFKTGIIENFWGWGWGYPNYGSYYGGYRYPYRNRRRYRGRRGGYRYPYYGGRGGGYWW